MIIASKGDKTIEFRNPFRRCQQLQRDDLEGTIHIHRKAWRWQKHDVAWVGYVNVERELSVTIPPWHRDAVFSAPDELTILAILARPMPDDWNEGS